MQIIISRGGNHLNHVKMVGDIVRRDFRNQVKFFHQNIVLQARVAERLFSSKEITNGGGHYFQTDIQLPGRLFQTFKIKTQAINSRYNFMSNTSLKNLCERSYASLQDLCIRNAQCLTNEVIVKSLSQMKNLQKLDLSYCKQIDDTTVTTLCVELPQLKNISLRFLNLITGESLKAVLENLKGLEGLDISGCFSIDLGCLTKLKGNQVLKCLLLEYLLLKSDHLRPLQDT